MDLTTLTIKDVMNETGYSRAAAYQLINDIKADYKVKAKRITMQHLKDYFGLSYVIESSQK